MTDLSYAFETRTEQKKKEKANDYDPLKIWTMWFPWILAVKVRTSGNKEYISSEHIPWKWRYSSDRLAMFLLCETGCKKNMIHHPQGCREAFEIYRYWKVETERPLPPPIMQWYSILVLIKLEDSRKSQTRSGIRNRPLFPA